MLGLYFPIPVLDQIGLYFVPAGMFPCGSVLSQHSPGLGVPQIHLVLLFLFFHNHNNTTSVPNDSTTKVPVHIQVAQTRMHCLSLCVGVCMCVCVIVGLSTQDKHKALACVVPAAHSGASVPRHSAAAMVSISTALYLFIDACLPLIGALICHAIHYPSVCCSGLLNDLSD